MLKHQEEYLNLSKSELKDMYMLVLDTLPENRKKYEIISEIIECQVYKTMIIKNYLISVNEEIQNIMNKNELSDFDVSRVAQLQLILRDLYN
jgi:hypothetical protein